MMFSKEQLYQLVKSAIATTDHEKHLTSLFRALQAFRGGDPWYLRTPQDKDYAIAVFGGEAVTELVGAGEKFCVVALDDEGRPKFVSAEMSKREASDHILLMEHEPHVKMVPLEEGRKLKALMTGGG